MVTVNGNRYSHINQIFLWSELDSIDTRQFQKDGATYYTSGATVEGKIW